MKDKTVREWISDLPSEVSIRFCNNLKQFGRYEYLHKVTSSYNKCIGGAFMWEATPEGHNYWSEIDDRDFDKAGAILAINTLVPLPINPDISLTEAVDLADYEIYELEKMERDSQITLMSDTFTDEDIKYSIKLRDLIIKLKEESHV